MVITWVAACTTVLLGCVVAGVSAVEGKCCYHFGAIVHALGHSARHMPQVTVTQACHGNTGVIAALLQLMLSFPGRRRSLKVCMLITASVFAVGGAWCRLCFTLLSHVNDSLISSTTALQKDLLREKKRHVGEGECSKKRK